MKKSIALLCAIVLVVALFAGCDGNTTPTTTAPATAAPATAAPATAAPATAAPATAAPATAAPSTTTEVKTTAAPAETAAVVEVTPSVNHTAENGNDSPYGVEYDENGVPTASHEYSLPLTTDDETFTYWFNIRQTNAEQYISDPSELLVWRTAQERTGVNIEYYMVSNSSCSTNFSVMLAGDELMDIMRNAKTYYNGSMATGIEDGYFANIYDYIEYCPNFHYYSCTQGAELKGACFLDASTIAYFSSINVSTIEVGGNVIRSDWLEDYGTTASEITTYDKLHDVLQYFKNVKGAEFPIVVMKTGDINFNGLSLGYNTKGSCGLITGGDVTPIVYEGGKIDFPYASDELHDYLAMMSQWYSEGFFSPDFTTFGTWTDFQHYMLDGTSGFTGCTATYTRNWNRDTTDGAVFVAMAKPVQSEGDILHLGGSTLYGGATFSISADCENIPLIVSWLDYFYSDEGMKLVNYGVEDVTYTVLDDGSIWWTDLMTNNPDGMSLAICYEYYTGFMQVGLADSQKGTYCESGKNNKELYAGWQTIPTDRAYEWPSGVQLTQEQSDEFANLWDDIQTFIIENQVQFITGDNDIAEWDDYVAEMKGLGNGSYDRCVEIYQEAYDRYMAMFG